MVEAAGGVVWRAGAGRDLEVLIVHRPRRDDWSLPKGKRRRGESAIACAIREVHEETGLRCIVEEELPPMRYLDRKGRDKRVRFWSMHPIEGEFRPNPEVDEVCWQPIDQVEEVLTYRRELTVVSALRLVLSHVA